ncbi:MAG: glycoside hydrolase family 3 protein [Candidatus Omnitrophica bacterium]|nr:glycoside hydrolase family 3 protein [Candidatus Omnitrophota bacterium]
MDYKKRIPAKKIVYFVIIFFVALIIIKVSIKIFPCLPAFSGEKNLERKIGQMILVGFNESDLDGEKSPLRQQIKSGQITGVILLSENLVNPAQVSGLIKKITGIRAEQPLFIAIDQEGGSVGRLGANNGFEHFPSCGEVASTKTPEEAYTIYLRMAKMLQETGINLNLAPVVDLDLSPELTFRDRRRAFSSDPGTVIRFAREFIAAHRKNNILTAIKHYPGMGSAKSDPHKRGVDVTKVFDDIELYPFSELIKEGMADMVMSAHIINSKVDAANPASLSAIHIEKMLKGEMGFRGLVITDDLLMPAITNQFSLEESAVKAVSAGNDILLFVYHLDNRKYNDLPRRVIKAIKRAVNSGEISDSRIEESFRKIIGSKRALRRN